jgi:hypothetical protein
MLEKLFDRSFLALSVIMFFVCATIYNIGYFGTLGDSLWYFFYIPTSIFDIIKTGLIMLFPLIIVLMVFKPFFINPAFDNGFPTGTALLVMAVLVLASNFIYSLISSSSQNRPLILSFEILFYLSTIVCVFAIIYYFLTNSSPQALMIVFLLSLIPVAFLIGIADAKESINSRYSETKSQILLKSDKIISAKILRSFDKGLFVMTDSASNLNFIIWDEIKEIKFKKVYNF